MKKKLTLALVVAFGLLLVSSCSTTVTSLKKDEDVHLLQDEGYLLMAVDTNISLDKLYISGEKNIVLTSQDLEAGTNYILINLPAGNYEFDKVKLSRYWRLNMSQDIWDFNIKPNNISYIGHLTVKSFFWGSQFRLELENKASQAFKFIKEKFPNILASKELAYGRSESDRFFELLNEGVSHEAK